MRRRAFAGALAVAAACAVAVPALAAGPSRTLAQRYAHRTFINDRFLGRRTYHLDTPRQAFTAADGSTITAFGAVLDSADGTGEIVLLFRGSRFLGWASVYDAVHLSVRTSGRSIAVTYGVYSGNDPFCCPHARKTVRYRWNGRRIVADGKPPLVYGRHGNRLHLT
jgi:LppP/LprE lipoprotein